MTDLAVVPSEEGTSIAVEGYGDVVVAPGTSTDNLQAADLLTQAMSELTQSLQEFRPGSTNITVHAPDTIQLSRLVAAAASTGTPTLLQVSICLGTVFQSRIFLLLRTYDQSQSICVPSNCCHNLARFAASKSVNFSNFSIIA